MDVYHEFGHHWISNSLETCSKMHGGNKAGVSEEFEAMRRRGPVVSVELTSGELFFCARYSGVSRV